ncbi:hypothetical protein Ga0100231_000555 [Opitutaceae bacterium TAV4]|nr:hypothetical protein Ga0100231_021890 [Opitutaceae bacterium TAV4]RRK01342.1 hypothetical protein Ga0100231_000555 [Opitutaceae bacterium TAV4]RRK01624.1 hypothetical protein Ga0100230_007220 [Opitutaceae bacterium TAV3]
MYTNKIIISFVSGILGLFLSPSQGASSETIGTNNIPIKLDYENVNMLHFSSWSTEKKIRLASVILIVKWANTKPKPHTFISEILKKRKDIELTQDAGNERVVGMSYEESTEYDGFIVFYYNNPPIAVATMPIEDGRIYAFGEMPLDKLREIVINSSK